MFKKAEKSKSFLRLLIASPSGGGKTYSSLSIASGITDKIAVVDTENGSASLYADIFNFDVVEMQKPYTVDKLCELINMASKSGYECLIIDSITHIWQEILDENEKEISASNGRLNSYTVWNKGTKKYRKFVDSLLNNKMHIICTSRMKTEYILTTNDKGKQTPEKVGLGIEQRGGIEYEFTCVLEGNINHVFTCTKDRTKLLQDEIIEKPTKELGEKIYNWLMNDNLKEKVIDYKSKIIECLVEKHEIKKEKAVKIVEENFKNDEIIASYLNDENLLNDFIYNYKVESLRSAIYAKLKTEEKIKVFEDLKINDLDSLTKYYKKL